MSVARKTASTPSTPSTLPLPHRSSEPERSRWGHTSHPTPAGTPAVQAARPPIPPAPALAPGEAGLDAPPRHRPRLNVTEQERLCYSRRKLEAISALRSVGIDPTIYGLHKDYRVERMRGKVYLVQHPTGTVYAFATLRRIRRYVADIQAWDAHARRTWEEWQQAQSTPQARRAGCSWLECQEEATGMLHGQPWCPAHAMIYMQVLAVRGRQAP